MHGELKFESVEAARRDLENRTLANIEGDFARLIYLASMRDYNTGEYHHEGMARRFSEASARQALAACHQDVFRRLVLCSLEELVDELELYIRTNCPGDSDMLRVWKMLEPYRVAVPLDCSPLTARYFRSNIRIALSILQSRRLPALQHPQSASPLR
jgi:hypothetical protein